MYLFKMWHRTHHFGWLMQRHPTGPLLIAQFPLGLAQEYCERAEASMEFLLHKMWGMFNMLAELPVHATMLVCRLI